MTQLSNTPLSARSKSFVLASALATIVTSIAIAPFASHMLGANLVVFCALYGCVVTASAITALALVIQHRSSGAAEPGILAIGYIIIAVGQALYAVSNVNGGALVPGVTSTSAPGWLFSTWHIAFLATMIYYAAQRRASNVAIDRPFAGKSVRVALVSIGLPATVAAAIAIVVPLPLSFASGHWTTLAVCLLSAIVVLGCVALGALCRRPGGPTMLDAWLALVVLVLVSDALLTLVGKTPGSLGWWTARFEHAMLAFLVLTVILTQTDRLYAQTLHAQSLLADEAMIDGLTGIPNRRKFDRVVDEASAHMRRSGDSFAIAILDIDRFKFYNDEFGHVAGDETLRTVAQALRVALRREIDFVARYGGEEFALVLPDTTLADGAAVAMRLCEAVQALRIPHASISLLQVVTISVGVAVARTGDTLEDVKARADEALYRAKANGRNRVEIETSPEIGRTTVDETSEQLAGTP